MLWLCFKLPSCLFGNTRDTSVMHEKVKCVCFIYMQAQKVKFKSVQINMKHVSYTGSVILSLKLEYFQARKTFIFRYSVFMSSSSLILS